MSYIYPNAFPLWGRASLYARNLPYPVKTSEPQGVVVWQYIGMSVHPFYNTIHWEQNKLLPIHCRFFLFCHFGLYKSASSQLAEKFKPEIQRILKPTPYDKEFCHTPECGCANRG